MAYRESNLHLFRVDARDGMVKDLIDMWHQLDSDYDEDSTDWRVDEDVLEGKYTSQAEKEVKTLAVAHSGEDLIDAVLEAVSSGHGDYSAEFKYKYQLGFAVYHIAVAYNT